MNSIYAVLLVVSIFIIVFCVYNKKIDEQKKKEFDKAITAFGEEVRRGRIVFRRYNLSGDKEIPFVVFSCTEGNDLMIFEKIAGFCDFKIIKGLGEVRLNGDSKILQELYNTYEKARIMAKYDKKAEEEGSQN